MGDPAYRAEYEALEEEFQLARALIETRVRAGLTQEGLAARMRTAQPAVARLKNVRTAPSTRTLCRFAEATGTRLSIRFEPGGVTSGT